MPRESLSDWGVLVGTFLPIIGVLATIVLAKATRGRLRWIVLSVVPALTLALVWWSLPSTGRDGNLLAVLLLMVYYVAVVCYYPILAIAAIVVARRQRRRELATQPQPAGPQ